jgi:hypothetical protein
LCSFYLAYDFNIFCKSAELLLSQHSKCLVGFMGSSSTAVVRSLCFWSLRPGCSQAAQYTAVLDVKTIILCRFTLNRFNNFHPKLPQPSSFPLVTYFLPQGQTCPSQPPFWLLGTFRALKGSKKEKKVGI